MPVPAGRVQHATPGKHRGLQPPTIAQLHEETRVMREAVMKGGERLTSASCGRWSSDRISSVEHTACFTDTTRNRQRGRRGVGTSGCHSCDAPAPQPPTGITTKSSAPAPWLAGGPLPRTCSYQSRFWKMWRWGPRAEALLVTSRHQSSLDSYSDRRSHHLSHDNRADQNSV